MDSKQFHFRTWVMVALMGVMLLALGVSMYQTQIVNGAYYANMSKDTSVETVTVDAVRGELTDSLGRVLVTNSVSYQVTLDMEKMGTAAQRNEILRTLLEVCRQSGVSWTDTLPVTDSAPYTYTSDQIFYTVTTNDQSETVQTPTRLYRLAVNMRWIKEENGQAVSLPTAQELLEAMYASFGLTDMEPEEARGVAGVLYELYLRSRDIYRTDYIFAKGVDVSLISQVKERSLSGVNIESVASRKYNTDYAAHLLGRVALMDADDWAYYKTVDLDGDGQRDYDMDDYVGKEGLEKAFESYLRGTSGKSALELNAEGKIIGQEWVTEPKAGSNVVLTLDIELQRTVEDILAQEIPDLSDDAQGAAAVVIDVNNGGILACASYPTFSLLDYSSNYSQYASDPLKPLYNRALLGTYAPGSTFKMVTGIAGLEEGIITPTTKIVDTGRYTYYTGYSPACWIWNQYRTTHGTETVSEAITDSCNVFFYDVGRRLGIERLQKYAAMFGLGQKTGLELAESSGVMAGPEYTESVGGTWYAGNTLSVAIGQESSQFTPIQLANYIATLVNGGTRYQTHLLKEVRSADYSEVVEEYQPVVLDTLDLDEDNLAAIKKGMLDLTTSGSLAKYFRDLDVTVGAKTGSAQVSATSSQSNAVLVCFGPYEDPEIAVAIVVERGGTGSTLGTIAAQIFQYYFETRLEQDTVTGENTLVD